MARFVKFIGVHGAVAVNADHVLYVAPLPDTGDCWLYFGGKGAAEEGKPAVIVVQVKGSLDEVVGALEAMDEPRGGRGRRDGETDGADDRPPLQAAAEDEPALLPPPR